MTLSDLYINQEALSNKFFIKFHSVIFKYYKLYRNRYLLFKSSNVWKQQKIEKVKKLERVEMHFNTTILFME